MLSEAMDVTIVSGVFALGGIILHHEYPHIRVSLIEYLQKKSYEV